MRIIFFETTEEEKNYLTELLKSEERLDVDFCKDKLQTENLHLAKDAEIISVFVNSEINSEVIASLPKLKLIATRSTGFDHIDFKFAKEKGVKTVNVPAYGSRTVAEFTFGLILNLSRKIFDARRQLLEGDNFDISKLKGFDLCGKTLGVVGTGRIGKNVIKIANGFEMKILAYDVFPDKEFAEKTEFKYVDLPELLSRSDIVTLHAPYNKDTHHLINKDNLPTFKKGAYLVNTARGELVETDALLKALASGHLSGAGLDVLESERQLKEEATIFAKDSDNFKDFKTLFEDQVLLDMPQVIVTPHIAFYSEEAEREIEKVTVENIKCFLNDAPQNLV